MKSQQGAGKDGFFYYFGKNIIGSKYYTRQDAAELICGRFNTEIENKIMIVLNEASREKKTIQLRAKD